MHAVPTKLNHVKLPLSTSFVSYKWQFYTVRCRSYLIIVSYNYKINGIILKIVSSLSLRLYKPRTQERGFGNQYLSRKSNLRLTSQ